MYSKIFCITGISPYRTFFSTATHPQSIDRAMYVNSAHQLNCCGYSYQNIVEAENPCAFSQGMKATQGLDPNVSECRSLIYETVYDFVGK
jgi:hypothetical protein